MPACCFCENEADPAAWPYAPLCPQCVASIEAKTIARQQQLPSTIRVPLFGPVPDLDLLQAVRRPALLVIEGGKA
jgi:hypothetical protein